MGSGPTTTTDTNQKTNQKINSATNETGLNTTEGTNLVQSNQLGQNYEQQQTQGLTGSYAAKNAYAPTEPVLQNIISQAQALTANPGGVTPEQQTAMTGIGEQATRNAALNPQIEGAAGFMLDGAGFGDGDSYINQGYNTINSALNPVARGDFLSMQSNPYLSGMLDSSMTNAMDKIGSQFAAAGRSFSGAHRDATASAMSEAALPHLFNNYQFERGQQSNAANALMNAGLGASAGVGQNRSGAVSAMQAAPGMLDTTYSPWKTMLDTSGTGIDNLSKISSFMLPMASAFGEDVALGSTAGSSVGQGATQQQSNQLTQQDILNMLNSTSNTKGKQKGTMSGTSVSEQENDPLSTAIGAGTMLGSAWLGSDRRMKDDIEKIGETFDGQSIYRFRYKGSAAFHIGLMADEVEKREPDAVTETSRGFKIVHYGVATERAAEMGRAH